MPYFPIGIYLLLKTKIRAEILGFGEVYIGRTKGIKRQLVHDKDWGANEYKGRE